MHWSGSGKCPSFLEALQPFSHCVFKYGSLSNGGEATSLLDKMVMGSRLLASVQSPGVQLRFLAEEPKGNKLDELSCHTACGLWATGCSSYIFAYSCEEHEDFAVKLGRILNSMRKICLSHNELSKSFCQPSTTREHLVGRIDQDPECMSSGFIVINRHHIFVDLFCAMNKSSFPSLLRCSTLPDLSQMSYGCIRIKVESH